MRRYYKSTLFIVAICLFYISIYADSSFFNTKGVTSTVTPAEDNEYTGDVLIREAYILKDLDKAMTLSSAAIDHYRKAVDDSLNVRIKDEKLFYKYVKAIVFKYNYLVRDEDKKEEKKSLYAEVLNLVNHVFPDDNHSIYIDFCKVMMWIENVEFYNIFEAATSGVADKILKYATRIYSKDKSFENHYAAAIIGRIHFLTPNIPFILTWPDLNESEKFLNEAISDNPDALLPKFFMADTLYALDKKEKAKELYRYVNSTEPRENFYFEDLRVKRDCFTRMKQLGIK